MRTLTAAQTRVLSLDQRSTHVRVFVDAGAGFIDMTTLEGRNWVAGIDYGGDVDTMAQQATVTFHRQIEELSLATLRDSSKLNTPSTILLAGNAIYIETATIAADTYPEAGDWEEVFRGAIDGTNWASSPMTVTARDDMEKLDEWIETESKRPVSATQDSAEDLMQEMLDAQFGASVVELFSINGTGATPFNTGDSPGFDILEYVQRKSPMANALRTIAEQIGWSVRYRWNDDTSAFQLTYYDPGRENKARGTLTLTGQPSNNETYVINATTLTAKTSGAGVDEFDIGATVAETCDNIVDTLNADSESANLVAWRVNQTVVHQWETRGTVGNAVIFTEALSNATADGSGTLGGTLAGTDLTVSHTFKLSKHFRVNRLSLSRDGVRNKGRIKYGTDVNRRVSVLVEDATSQAQFGKRYFEIALGASDQIDTQSEARRLADAVIYDLADPKADQVVSMPYFWAVEPGDYYKFEADGLHYDADQSLAVVAWKHKIDSKKARTKLTTRGKPAGGFNRWLSIEARPGVGTPNPFYAHAKPDNVVATAGVGTIIFEYDDPRGMSPPIHDWELTRVYVETSTISLNEESVPVAQGKQTRFEIDGLIPGTEYFIIAQIWDSKGNVSASSTEVQVATQKNATYHNNEDGQAGNIVRNPSFGENTLPIATDAPDGWGTPVGWGTTIDEDTTTLNSGNRAISFTTGWVPGDGWMISELAPIGADSLYRLNSIHQCSATGSLRVVSLIEFFDKDKVALTTLASKVMPINVVDTWESEGFFFRPTTSEATARYLRVHSKPVVTGDVVKFDLVSVVTALPSFDGYAAAAQAITTGTPTVVEINTEIFDYGGFTRTTIYGLDTATNVGRFTCFDAGLYRFEGAVGLTALDNAIEMEMGFLLGGALLKTCQKMSTGAVADMHLGGAVEVELARDDYVEMYVEHQHGSNRNIVTGAAKTFFSGAKIDQE